MTTAAAVRERPILFSGPMVRALLDGKKTQTRRVVKGTNGRIGPLGGLGFPVKGKFGSTDFFGGEALTRRCPYGQPGDRLWVRETWAAQRFEPCFEHELEWQHLKHPTIRYADGMTRECRGTYHGLVEVNKSPIYMPRWASRLTLEITDVRVQRVQEISAADAVAEGVTDILTTGHPLHSAAYARGVDGPDGPGRTQKYAGSIEAFAALWDSLNATRGHSWESNPWVWALTFRRVDALGGAR